MQTPSISVLGPSREADVRTEPFAYAVVDEPLDQRLYERLSESFPPADWFLRHVDEAKSNQAVRIPASHVIGNDRFAKEWQDFFSYHTSSEFWADIVRVFGSSLRAAFPDLEERVGRPLEDWRVGRRGENPEADVRLDLLFVINTAVQKPSSVRPAHVDREQKIFSGLFYMRAEDDPTPGGDLALYRPLREPVRFGGHYVEPEAVEEARLVEYTANRFLGFVNSGQALHGVTERPRTEHIRRYINFVVEMPFPAFKLQKLPAHRRLLFKLRHRLNKAPGVTLGPDQTV